MVQKLMRHLMEQLMGINGENIFLFLKANCSEIERMNERQKPEKPLAINRNKGCSKNQVELIFDFLEMNFCKFRQSHSPLCSFLN